MRQITFSAIYGPRLRCAQHYRAARPSTLHCKPTFGLLLCSNNLTQSAALARVARRRPSSALHAEGVAYNPILRTILLARSEHQQLHMFPLLQSTQAVHSCSDLAVEQVCILLSQVAQSPGQEQRQGSLRNQTPSSRKRLLRGTCLSPLQ